MKKLISIFLSLVMALSVFSCMGMNAYAATSTSPLSLNRVMQELF